LELGEGEIMGESEKREGDRERDLF